MVEHVPFGGNGTLRRGNEGLWENLHLFRLYGLLMEQTSWLFCFCGRKLRLKTYHRNNEIYAFWSKLSGEYPILSSRGMRMLVPFPTTYMCETGFSAMVAIKTKANKPTKSWGRFTMRLVLDKDQDSKTCAGQTHTLRTNWLVGVWQFPCNCS